jgi:hypothetical protein
MKLPYTRLEDPPDIRLGYLRPSNTVSVSVSRIDATHHSAIQHEVPCMKWQYVNGDEPQRVTTKNP